MDFLAGIASCIVTKLFNSACIAVGNVRHLKRDFRSMEDELKDLDCKKQDTIENLERQKSRPTHTASDWIEKVENIKKTVRDIKDKYDPNMPNRLLGCCPDCWVRLKISSETRTCKDTIKNLIEQHRSENSGFGGRIIPDLRANSYIELESFEKKKFEIEESLLTENVVRKVAVWGREGAGKTTLLTQIYNSTTVREYFNYNVFWIDLAADKISIQKSILQILDLTRDSSPTDLKHSIYSHLKEKKYLLIIDDFQDRNDLQGRKDLQRFKEEGVGLPLTEVEQNYKIVFGCEKEEACQSIGVIGVTKPFEMTKLSITEGFRLFRELIKDVSTDENYARAHFLQS